MSPGGKGGIDPYLPQNGNKGYRIDSYDLDLDYRAHPNRLEGAARLRGAAVGRLAQFSLDLGGGLKVGKVRVNGAPATRYRHHGGKLTITCAEVRAGGKLDIEVRYAGTPRPVSGVWGEVGWEELNDGVLVANQPNGAASWFPCNDHPSFKATYTIAVTADSAYTVVAGGTLVRKKVRAGRTTWVYEQREPMSSYLATVQIGRYTLHQVAKAPVQIHAAVPRGLRKRFEHDFARQQQMLRVFSTLFGPYPFRTYTVVVADEDLEIPIEAQSLSIFGANHCDGKRGSERLVAHELAHQWFGNSVTAARWRDIWLHEGFACYAEWLWSEESGGPTAHALAKKHWGKLDDAPKDLVLGDPGPARMFDDRLYKRGALTVHSLRRELGDEKFFTVLHDWTRRHRYGTVDTADFVATVKRHSHKVPGSFWKSWLQERSLPKLG